MEPNEEDQTVKREICSSPFIKPKSPTSEEIQTAIDEINEKRSAVDESENEFEGAINIDKILLSKNFADKEALIDKINKANEFTSTGETVNINPTEKMEIGEGKKISDFDVINADPYLKPFEKKIK